MILKLHYSSSNVGRVDFIVLVRHKQANIRYGDSHEIAIFFTKSRKLRNYHSTIFAKLKCREIWLLQIREIEVSRKLHVTEGIYKVFVL